MRVREMSAGNLFYLFSRFSLPFAFSRQAKATFFGYFLVFRCLSSFLAALKATDFAGFSILRCLFAFSRQAKATFLATFTIYVAFLSRCPLVHNPVQTLLSQQKPAAPKPTRHPHFSTSPQHTKKARKQQLLCHFRAFQITIIQISKSLTNSISTNQKSNSL